MTYKFTYRPLSKQEIKADPVVRGLRKRQADMYRRMRAENRAVARLVCRRLRSIGAFQI